MADARESTGTEERAAEECAADDEQLFQEIRSAFLATQRLAPADPSARPGDHPALTREIEGYEILRELHRGGQGIVYQARQLATKRMVALKVLLRGAQATERQRHRFEREVELVAGLVHPNIVTIYDSGISRGRPFYAMEFVAGQPLDKFLNSASPQSLPIRDRLRLFHKICDAVSYAHQRGVIHRDLKPGNIVIDAAGQPHVLDFGLAKLINTNREVFASLTIADEFMGTLAYASPEQTHGAQRADVRSDVYALGVILYQLLTLRLPYDVSGSLSEIIRQITTAEPLRPSLVSREMDAELDAMVLRALAKEPQRRYQSAEQFARDIGHYLAGEPIDAKRDSTLYIVRKSIRRYRAAAVTTLAFLFVVVAALAASVRLWREAVVERDTARAAQASERVARIAEKEAREAEQTHREEAEFQAYTANIAAAAGALQANDVVEASQRLQAAPERLRDWEWRQRAGRLDGSQRTLLGHTAGVTDVVVTDDGSLIASASREDHTVRVWDTSTGEQLATIDGLPWPAIAFHPDSKRLAVATREGTIRLWSVETRQFVASLELLKCYVDVLKFSPDGNLLAAGVHHIDDVPGKHALLLFDVKSGQLTHSIPQDRWQVNDLAFGPDGSWLATVHFDGVALWETQSGRPRLRLPDQPGNKLCVATSRDGKLLATGGRNHLISIHEAENGRLVRELAGHTGAVTALGFGPGDEHVLSGSRDKTVRVWRVATGEAERTLAGHTWNVTAVALSSDGRRIVSSSWDKTIKLWDGVDAKPRDILVGHAELVATVAYSNDERFLATASWDRTVKLWDLATRSELATLPGHDAPVHGVAFSPDGRLLATCGWNGAVRLWDVATRSEIANLRGHAGDARVHAVAFAPSGQWLVSGASDDTLQIWNTTSHECLAVLTGHTPGTDHIHAVAVSLDGKWIASAGHQSVKIWDAENHSLTASFPRRMVRDDYSLAFHPDGRRVAAGSDERTITFWDFLTKVPTQVFTGHSDEIHAVAISPDGRRLVSASFDNSLKVWDIPSGREVATLVGHPSSANTVAFSPSGRYLAAGLANGSVKIWDGGESSATKNGHDEPQLAAPD